MRLHLLQCKSFSVKLRSKTASIIKNSARLLLILFLYSLSVLQLDFSKTETKLSESSNIPLSVEAAFSVF